eukprot:1142501-Rhodomonas_salina.2
MALPPQGRPTCSVAGSILTMLWTQIPVTCYVLSLNGAPISWKAKRQDCVTLSSAEAELEYVAASMCWQKVVYLRDASRTWVRRAGAYCLGYEELEPTGGQHRVHCHCQQFRHWRDEGSDVPGSSSVVEMTGRALRCPTLSWGGRSAMIRHGPDSIVPVIECR